MPKCQRCGNSVRSDEILIKEGGDGFYCAICCKQKDAVKRGPIIGSTRKKLFSMEVFEVSDTRNGDVVDYSVSVVGDWKGMELKFGVTVDQIRDFFTKKRNTKR